MSNLINLGVTPGYLASGESAVSAGLLIDPQPQADRVRQAWQRIPAAKQRYAKFFEQHVPPMVAEGTTGIPPSAQTRCP